MLGEDIDISKTEDIDISKNEDIDISKTENINISKTKDIDMLDKTNNKIDTINELNKRLEKIKAEVTKKIVV